MTNGENQISNKNKNVQRKLAMNSKKINRMGRILLSNLKDFLLCNSIIKKIIDIAIIRMALYDIRDII